MADDTIIAVSTPPGFGGLGVLRLSGPAARRVASRLFKPHSGRRAVFPPRTAVLGDLLDSRVGERLDEAVLTYFPGPASYTREDLVEIACHGSPIILEQAVRLGVKAGARHALPGEFTRRAYLAGRMDILQAQAVNDLIMARSLEQAKISARQLGGSLSRRIASVRGHVLNALTLLETSIEFPEDGPPIPADRVAKTLGKAAGELGEMVQSFDIGRALLEGTTIVISGRPNVGKSTLFNALLEEDRAIVAPHPGTTRDFLRERLRIGDSHFTLIDTAGLAATKDPVENEGRERGRRLAAEAGGVLALIDASTGLMPQDASLLRGLKDKNKKAIIVLNKCDLKVKTDLGAVARESGRLPMISVSALSGKNIRSLRRLILKRFAPSVRSGKEVVLHLHQKLLLEEVQAGLERARKLLSEGFGEEIGAEEVRSVLPSLGRLTGEIKSQDVIDMIFSRFCIGK